MTITQVPLSMLPPLALWTIAAAALALIFAPQIAARLIRFRVGRLPDHLAQRYSEEWIAELHSISNRVRKLTFAIAISVMRRKTLVDAEEGLAIPGLNAPIVLSVEDVRVYSDFWHRLGALVIDVILSAITSAVVFRLLRNAVPASAIALLYSTMWVVVVQVYCVCRFGGSPGKLALKMRIVAMGGEALTSRHALVRALPGYAFGVVGILLGAWAISQVDSTVLAGLPRREQNELLLATIPIWIRWPFQLSQCAWVLADLAVFFDSYERRALHDVIAGTVVVYKIPRVVGLLSNNPPVGSTSAYR